MQRRYRWPGWSEMANLWPVDILRAVYVYGWRKRTFFFFFLPPFSTLVALSVSLPLTDWDYADSTTNWQGVDGRWTAFTWARTQKPNATV